MKAILCTSLVFFLMTTSVSAADTAQAEGFSETVTAKVFSKRLNSVDAIITLENGLVYVLDSAKNHIIEFRDRGLDGKPDSVRTLPQRFNHPSDMVLQEGRLYVADIDGIWVVNADGSSDLIASLKNAKANGPVFMVSGDQKNTLVLGFSRENSSVLIDLDINTRIAHLRTEEEGQLLALKRIPGAGIWTSVALNNTQSRFSLEMRTHAKTLQGHMTDFLVLEATQNWNGELIAVMDNTKVVLLSIDFGILTLPGRDIISALNEKTRKTAKGRIGAITADPRGLFVFNNDSKTLWLVNPNSSPMSDLKASPVSSIDTEPDL